VINLAPSSEQSAIAAAADAFLKEQLPISRIRELASSAEAAIDDGVWRQCAQMGWLTLSLPEAEGGLGLGLPEEVMLFRELGRHLATGPFLSSVLGLRVVARSGEKELAAAIAEGRRRVGISAGGLAVNLRAGDLLLEIDEMGASVFDVAAVDPAAGVDPTVPFAHADKGDRIARLDDANILSRARVLAAAELCGIIEAVRDMAASYAKTRVQFDKPIGSFQAVKHLCADMAVSAYSTVAQLFFAAVLVDAERPDAQFHAASAYVFAVNAARVSAADNIQIHGGIGFSWEQDSHLYLKRAFLLEHLFGRQRESYRMVLKSVKHNFDW
jgi:alkylation response protein AidB-like acyl-CoA dehydrogenase